MVTGRYEVAGGSGTTCPAEGHARLPLVGSYFFGSSWVWLLL